jgi:hypothetical protein
MQATLTLQDSLARRLLAWAGERFPMGNVIGCAVIFLCAMVVGRASGTTGALAVGPLDVLSMIAAISFFLLLRVFDEHKDYEEDLPNYPERVLSRGLITLNQLKGVGAVCVFLQLGTVLAADRGVGRATLAWTLALAYAVLMLKEFFIADWLKPRLAPYALSHMVVSPLATLWFYLVGHGARAFGPELAWLCLLAYATSAAFEVTRKTRGPEEERPTVDSYSKTLGIGVAALVMVVVLGAALFATLCLLQSLSASFTALVITSAFYLPIAGSIAAFVAKPSEKGRKLNEGLAALALIACHVAPVAVVLSQRGLSW